jgi:hypothetical protein
MSSSLFAELTPMFSERAVIMVISKVDDQHLTVSVIPERTIKCSKPGCRSGGSAIARSARGTHPAGAGHRGPRHHSYVGLDFAGPVPRWCVRMEIPWVRQADGSDYASP